MLYLECNSIIILHRASALIVHVGGGREGKIGNQLHRLFYNVHGISSLSFWRDSSSRIARVFSVAQWPNGRQVSCRGLQVIQRIKKREMFTHQGLLFKMWILAILQHPQMHHHCKRQRQRRLTDLEKKTGAWRINWNKLWVCSLTGIPNMMMMISKMTMGGIEIGASLEHFKREDLSLILKKKLKLLADKKDTGIVNIAASIISRFATIFCSFFLFLVFFPFSETLCHRHTWPRQRVVHDLAEQIENGSLMEENKHVSELVASWVLVRGKGGGFGRRIYRGLAKVFKLHRLGNFPPFEQIRSLWKNEMLTPINACTEGTSQVLWFNILLNVSNFKPMHRLSMEFILTPLNSFLAIWRDGYKQWCAIYNNYRTNFFLFSMLSDLTISFYLFGFYFLTH